MEDETTYLLHSDQEETPTRSNRKVPGEENDEPSDMEILQLRSKIIDHVSKAMTHLVPSPKISKGMHLLASMILLTLFAVFAILALSITARNYEGHKLEPKGSYKVVSTQEGADFFDHYTFYEGVDSLGSNGYQKYVGYEQATSEGFVKLLDQKDDYIDDKDTTFVHLGTAPGSPSEEKRKSIRLEGKRRWNRGLFVFDFRHMPAGCGTWPAFWLTDENNWPVNGEIDIVEGINFQSIAKTAMHTSKKCDMSDIPIGLYTGWWDSAVGVPDGKTGKPDMTMRLATDCYVYDPHQWINQGCVAVDLEDGGMGEPLNEVGGGVYVLEWDPINKHIRSWAFRPHEDVPQNLKDAIMTVNEDSEKRVDPDPNIWPLPYAYFAMGEGTKCASNHFRNMRLVINTAFCGSVAGNRYFMDCPKQKKKYNTCEEWITSEEGIKKMEEAYWLIRGVYVFEREWM